MMEMQEGISMGKIFTLMYWIDQSWYVGKLKEVPGVFSQGRSLDDLKINIVDAYHLMLKEENTVLPNIDPKEIKEVHVEI